MPTTDTPEQNLDITGADDVEIVIREDGKVVWANTKFGCKLRICRVEGKVIVEDNRK